MAECFQIAGIDNVATLLTDAEPGKVAVGGEGETREVAMTEPIRMGHKVALCAIGEGELVVKYGVTIGVATRAIAPGEWVHLHNCKSLYDAVSSKVDVVTGARGETPYA
jgi:altronate dehydratase small subunit